MTRDSHCELCQQAGGEVVYEDQTARVVLVSDPLYPGFCRVIYQEHIAEMSDLENAQRVHLMALVWQVEQILRREMQPSKINLASLGNMTPHLHWHVIPRFTDDAHFPQPVWGQVQRSVENNPAHAARVASLPTLAQTLRQALSQ